MPQRSLEFAQREGRRYWWHGGQDGPGFVPPVYSFLTEDEWGIVNDWFDETDRCDLIGECQVPLISLLQGLVMGNMVGGIVQAGHYAGYSTLMLGFMLRRMGRRHGLFTIDIDASLCDYTRKWVERAALSDYVLVKCADSSDPALPDQAREYFGGPVRIVFIDSSHTYEHTVRELALWCPVITPSGFLVCHDSAPFAEIFDRTGKGGVRRAVTEWRQANPAYEAINIRGSASHNHREGVYQDGCGVFIAQKPVPAANAS